MQNYLSLHCIGQQQQTDRSTIADGLLLFMAFAVECAHRRCQWWLVRVTFSFTVHIVGATLCSDIEAWVIDVGLDYEIVRLKDVQLVIVGARKVSGQEHNGWEEGEEAA